MVLRTTLPAEGMCHKIVAGAEAPFLLLIWFAGLKAGAPTAAAKADFNAFFRHG